MTNQTSFMFKFIQISEPERNILGASFKSIGHGGGWGGPVTLGLQHFTNEAATRCTEIQVKGPPDAQDSSLVSFS